MIRKLTILAIGIILSASALEARSKVLSRDAVRTELKSHSIFRSELRDNHYILPNGEWLQQSLIPFYVAYAQQNLAPALGNDSMSSGLCKVFQSIMYQANIRGGGSRKGDVPVGVAMTRTKGDSDIRHHVIIRTQEGWSIIDPNDGQLASLDSFKATNDIIRVAI